MSDLEEKSNKSNRKTKVVNARVAHLQPKYKNLADWMSKKNHVYIGRRGIVFIKPSDIPSNIIMNSVKEKVDKGEESAVRFPPKDSPWANPYKVPQDGTLQEVLAKYEKYIRGKIESKEVDLEELRGKRLACWCVSKPTSIVKLKTEWICHGECLLFLLNERLDNSTKETIKHTDKEAGVIGRARAPK